MLNIKNESKIVKKIKNRLIRITNYLENNNSCNFKTNGEEKFIDVFFQHYLELRSQKPYMENFAYANYIAISKNTLGELNKC